MIRVDPRLGASGGAAPSAKEARFDDALVAAAIGGDDLAFDHLDLRHRHAALRLASTIVGPARAEDVVRDSFLIARRGLASLRDKTKFSRWLLAIVRWRALEAGWRDGRESAAHATPDAKVLGVLSDIACVPRHRYAADDRLLAGLDTIPPQFAEVIRYHFLHRLSHQRVAEFLNVPLATVEWRCFRGKEILRLTHSPEPACTSRCPGRCARFPGTPEAVSSPA